MKVLLLRAALVGAVLANGCATSREAGDGGDVRVAPKEPWRAARPASGPAPELKLPSFQKAELKNGMVVILVEDHGLPTIHAVVVVKAGAVHDGKDAGLANLTYDVLDEGAGSFNAPGLANAFADIGSEVDASAHRESGSVSADFLKQNADKGLELLALVVQKPAFAQADFDRVKKLHIDALKAKEGDPETISSQMMVAEVFGSEHAYGRPYDGTASTVEKLKQSSAKRFWSDFAGPKSAALVLAGDLTLDEAKALAEKHFGKWRGGGKAQKAPLLPKAKTAVKIYVINFPGAPQTQIRVARPLIAVGDPDEPAMTVMNQILGGMFTSRLNLKLREEKQWTYGAFSQFDARTGPGPFVLGADVQTASTGDALQEIFAQLDTLKTGGVTEAELALGKQNFVKSIPGLFSLPPLQVDVATDLFALGLPLDHHATQLTAINAVTVEAVNKAAQRAIVKEDFVVVLTGDRAAIEAGLKDKNLGEVIFLNKDGTPAAPTPK
ncbi:MAG: pitrilysin family protein [Deltaproteobacteria bacterium]|nr:pitrilysin family protein [Deltaproteobacteria bacterium]